MKHLSVKKALNRLALATAGCLMTASALAGPYVGTAMGIANIEADGARGKARNTTVLVIAGHQFTPHFALEARLGAGLQADSATFNGQKMTIDTNRFIGVYGKAMLPLQGSVTPYLLLGATRGTTTSKVAGFRERDTDTDVSYGIGLDWAVTQRASLTLEVIDWFDKDDANVRGVNLGAKMHF